MRESGKVQPARFRCRTGLTKIIQKLQPCSYCRIHIWNGVAVLKSDRFQVVSREQRVNRPTRRFQVKLREDEIRRKSSTTKEQSKGTDDYYYSYYDYISGFSKIGRKFKTTHFDRYTVISCRNQKGRQISEMCKNENVWQ